MTTALEAITNAFPGAELVGYRFEPERKKRIKPVDHTKTDEIGSLIALDKAQGCSHPIRLSGKLEVADGATGELVHQWNSETDESSGTVYVPCKTRRADKCESCAKLYQGDAFRLIVNGLRGGDWRPESVSKHPALFVTFTAPSFGVVHRQIKKGDEVMPCRPRRNGEHCHHGVVISCGARHHDGDHRIGQAMCADCFDYTAAATWNHFAGKLWRQTRKQIDRELASILGVSQKKLKDICTTQFVKIAEFQRRGLVHFHVAIRVDGSEGGIPKVTAEQLASAVVAARSSEVEAFDGDYIGWGDQLDIKVIRTDKDREQLAGYFAKYATKSADANGQLHSRVREEAQIDWLPVNDHIARLIRAAWRLTNEHDDCNAARWAHQFGFGGHFLTKSRSWSTTFKALRQRRSDHHAEMRKASWQSLSPKAQLVIQARWEYVGSGFASATDAHVAAMQRAQYDTTTVTEAA